MTFELTSFDIIKGKVIRDGKVAIITQDKPGGIGWYTQHGHIETMYDPYIVDMICNKKQEKLSKYISEKCGPKNETYAELLSAYGYLLSVIWLPVGTEFEIRYDNYVEEEILFLKDEQTWMKAGED
jgi:hypothetical protein